MQATKEQDPEVRLHDFLKERTEKYGPVLSHWPNEDVLQAKNLIWATKLKVVKK